MAKFTVGTRTFRTKLVAFELVRKILREAYVGELIVGENFIFLLHVMNLRPQPHKIGKGIKEINVEYHAGRRRFMLTRVDGTREEWSYHHCFALPVSNDLEKAS